ncbi:MAG TPA: hypothetical protein VGI05_22025 [Streptosporangiaceae bacterium]|jgi:hypothetical protein
MAADDPLLKKAYAGWPGEPVGPFDHLIHHSDCEGYYVPVDFGQVIVDERLAGGYLGSSVRLLAETAGLPLPLTYPKISIRIPKRSPAHVTPAHGQPKAGSVMASSHTCACGSSRQRSIRSRPGQ